MKLLEFYKSLFNFAGLEVSADGKLYTGEQLSDQKQPILINGAQLVLPTKEHLKNSDPSRIIVHPLAESLTKQMSPTIDRLMKILIRRFNLNIGEIGMAVIGSLLNVKEHSHFTGDQLQMMQKLSTASDWTTGDLSTWQLVASDAQKEKSARLLVNIYVTRGGSYKGQKNHRTCTVWFPFYEYLCKLEKGEEASERKLNKGQIKKFKLLMEFILCGVNDKEYYCHGTNSQVAPFLVALYTACAKMAMEINDLISNYGEPIAKTSVDITNISYNLDWYDSMLDLSVYEAEARMIPVQIGGDGNFVIKEEQQPAPAYAQPTQQPVYNPQQMQGYVPPVQPVAPPPSIAGKTKASWNEVVGSSQTLQQTVMGNRQMPYMQGVLPQQEVPSWAMPQQSQMYPQQMHPGMMPQPMYPQQMHPGMMPQQGQMYPPQHAMMYPQQMSPGMMQQMPPQMYQQPVMRYPT